MRPHLPFDRRRLRTGTFRPRAVGVALVLVMGAGLAASAVSASAATRHHAGRGATLHVTGNPGMPGALGRATPQTGRPPQNTTVMLPTGDRVRLDSGPGGAQQATPVTAGNSRAESTFLRFTWSGDQYVIPDQAVPFLHSVLDPRLFDVSYLARAHLGTGRTGIPLRISYTSAHATASLPGVRVTRRSGATATATITSTRAAQLGQLLAARWRVSRLPGIRKISLAAPPGASPLPASPSRIPAHTSAASHGLPYYTLTINATDLDGNPGTFAGIVQDVGNAALFDQSTNVFTSAATGSESLSVPKGTYSLAISIVTPDPSGSGFDTALVVKPQVSVDSDTTVSVDARTAVPYQAQLSTPVTATQRWDVLQFWRTSVTGGGNGAAGGPLLGGGALTLGLVAITPGPVPLHADSLLAAPTAPVTKGSFVFDATSWLSTGSTTAPGPTYTFDFPHQATIPSSLTYTVPQADLTTVQSQIYDTPSACGTEELNTFGFLRLAPGQWERNMYFQTGALPTGPRTDYWYSSDPQLDYWEPGSVTDCQAYFGPPQRIRPGQQISYVWNKLPTAPSLVAPPVKEPDTENVPPFGDPRLAVCAACRQGDIGTVNILPYGGPRPTVYSEQPVYDADDGNIEFYRDGTLAIDSATEGAGVVGGYPWGLELPLLPQAASYELDSSYTRPDDSAATVDTDWTFQSGPGDPGATLPSTETCAPDATQSCSFLPLLFLRYDLPLNYNDQATAGTSEPVDFTVTSQQNAPAPSGLSATVSASFDGGQTWTTPGAATSLGNGRFSTTISQPALADTNGSVALKVTATDGSGDSVTQTLIDAYGLTS